MAKDHKQGIILSLGSVNADFQVRIDQEPGSTTTMMAHDFMRLSGGKASNVACLARHLGAAALLMAHIGNDDLGEQALQSLQDMKVDFSYVAKVEGASTGFSMIAVPPGGKKQIILAPNANDAWEEKDRQKVRKAIEDAPQNSVLVVDYEVPPFIVEEAIHTAHGRGFKILLDPSPAERVDRKLYSKISFVSPDAAESESLTGIKPDSVENAVQTANKLQEQGAKTAIVRMEEGGCVVMDKKATLHIPAVKMDVVDTTGAGDTFCGAFAVAVLEQRNLREAACFATAAAALSVTAYGSQPAYPSRAAVEELFNKINTKIRTVSS